MRLLLAALTLAFAPIVAAAELGTVTVTEGDVRLLRGDAYYQAVAGVELARQDVVETGAGASAQLDMADGSILKLGPDTRLALSEYQIDDQRHVVRAGLDVLAGWLRFAVAKLGPDARYRIDSPVMSVGIRGTEGVLQAGSDGGEFALDEGAVDITAPNDAGVPPAHVVAGQFVERRRGDRFQLQRSIPARFAQRLPAGLRAHLQRRIHLLRQRGVPPRMIRRVMRRDAQRHLRAHPGMQPEMRQRFERMQNHDRARRREANRGARMGNSPPP